MAKRQLILDTYKTAESGLWTLSSCNIIKASQVQNFVSVPGRFSPLDLSTASNDGIPYYDNAGLEAVLESSVGTRTERQERITQMVNLLDGYSMNIVHPDHPAQYLVGRVQITPLYNNPVHCSVRVDVICEPWFYNEKETVITKTLTSTEQTVELTNSGRLAMVPKVVVSGSATITYGTKTWTLNAGTHYLPDIFLTPGNHTVACTGSGTLSFTYREGVLAE